MIAVLDRLVESFGIEIVQVTAQQADLAYAAFVAYGKGGGHPAQLNFGDLFSYALAKARGIPLLFKGEDFAATNIQRATA